MGPESFTFIDVLVVATMLVSACWAAYRGFVRESLSIAASLAAGIAALLFGPAMTRMLAGTFSGWAAVVAGYGLVFFLVMLPLTLVSYRFSESIQRSQVGPIDRALGLVFGAVRGLALIAVCYIVLGIAVAPENQPYSIRDARSLPLIQSSALTVLSLLPTRDRGFLDRTPPAHEAVAHDPIARLVERSEAPANPVHRPGSRKHAIKKPKKTYGANDRDALNKLIESNGGGDQP